MMSSPTLRVDAAAGGRGSGSAVCGRNGANVLGVTVGQVAGVHRLNSAWRPKFIWARCGAGSAVCLRELVGCWLCCMGLQDAASRAAQSGRTQRAALAKEREGDFFMGTPERQVAWERCLVSVSACDKALPPQRW